MGVNVVVVVVVWCGGYSSLEDHALDYVRVNVVVVVVVVMVVVVWRVV